MTYRSILLQAVFWLGSGLSAACATSLTTWVAATGKDTGTCSVTVPCATFQYAHNETTPGGTVSVATPGSYGPVSITKSISIIAPVGVEAIINVAANGQGIVLNNSGASIVLLKGITITGPGTSPSSAGIYVGGSFTGQLTMDHITISNSYYGATLDSNAFVLIESCLIDSNFFGILLYDSAVYMGKTTISGNQQGLSTDASISYTINSYGDNILNGNIERDLTEVSVNEVPHDQ